METRLGSAILQFGRSMFLKHCGMLNSRIVINKEMVFASAYSSYTVNQNNMSTQIQTQNQNVNSSSASESDSDVIASVSKNPLNYEDYFNVRNLFTIEDLIEARVHFGHKEGSLDNRMKPYLFGTRLGHTIFDLDKTAVLLRDALNITAHIAYRGGVIMFLGQYPQHSLLIEKTAKECKEFAHTRRWRVGLFTNSSKMYGAVTRLPDLCIFINTLDTVLEQSFGVTEAAKMLIPTVGIVDSNCNPNIITYPVPGNDDTAVSVQLYCKLFKEAILRGKSEREKVLEEYKKCESELDK